MARQAPGRQVPGPAGPAPAGSRPVSRTAAGRAAGGAWQWQRTAQTQRALLDAARAVFAEQGFAEASIADVVERAGSSVGSLYHHFGGKSELFLALWQEHQAAHEEAASSAVADARPRGHDRPDRAVLRRSAGLPGGQLAAAGPGHAVRRGRRADRVRGHQARPHREWLGQNDALLKLPDTALDRLYAAVLTSLIGEGAREVAMARTRRQASQIIDAVIEYVRRLMGGGPWKPAP